jgi:hypothetical protein
MNMNVGRPVGLELPTEPETMPLRGSTFRRISFKAVALTVLAGSAAYAWVNFSWPVLVILGIVGGLAAALAALLMSALDDEFLF